MAMMRMRCGPGEAGPVRWRRLAPGALLLLTGPLAATAGAWCEVEEFCKLVASDAETGDAFGNSVAIEGATALIGAPGQDDMGTHSGCAYVFAFDGSAWIEEAKLLASDGQPIDRFGCAVSLDGEVALIGAKYNGQVGYFGGAAYVFRFDGSQWIEEAKLTASDGNAEDEFGRAVAVSGDAALIGVYRDSDLGLYSGSAYVFRFDGDQWVEEAKLTASDAVWGEYFGYSVSIDGDAALIGAVYDDDLGELSGSAYVFRFDGDQWIEEAKLTASDGAAHDVFGDSVSINGDVAVVGASCDDDNGYNTGSVFVFRFDGTEWIEEAKLHVADLSTCRRLGTAVFTDGGTILAGAGADFHGGSGSGAVYIFRHDGQEWIEAARLVASDPAEGQHLGLSVGFSGPFAITGAEGDEQTGAAYVFEMDPCPPDPADVNGDGVVDVFDLLLVLAAWGNTSGPEDINGDGIVNVLDLLEVLANWS